MFAKFPVSKDSQAALDCSIVKGKVEDEMEPLLGVPINTSADGVE